MAMEGGEVTSFPLWMLGNEEAFITAMVCDLARLHAGFANSPVLDDELFTKIDGAPDWIVEKQLPFMPGLAPLLGDHFAPCTDAEAEFIGCAAGIPSHDAFQALLENKREKLRFEYEVDGTRYWCGQRDGAPMMMPNPMYMGEKGKAIVLKVMEKMGSRKIQTMIHGDGHPGNMFYQEGIKQ